MEIQIVCGFFDAGKTTFLNKYLPSLSGRVAVIENDVGKVSLETRWKAAENVEKRSLYAGCICCSLEADFISQVKRIVETGNISHVLIEAASTASLSELIKICNKAEHIFPEMHLSRAITLVDIHNYEDDKECTGSFYMGQIRNADLLVPTHLSDLSKEKINASIKELKRQNKRAYIIEEDYRNMPLMELKKEIEKSGYSKIEMFPEQLKWTPGKERPTMNSQ